MRVSGNFECVCDTIRWKCFILAVIALFFVLKAFLEQIFFRRVLLNVNKLQIQKKIFKTFNNEVMNKLSMFSYSVASLRSNEFIVMMRLVASDFKFFKIVWIQWQIHNFVCDEVQIIYRLRRCKTHHKSFLISELLCAVKIGWKKPTGDSSTHYFVFFSSAFVAFS